MITVTRAVAWSNNGGDNWSPVSYDYGLPDPQCQGSMIRFTRTDDYERSRILFSNAADVNQRVRMTVRLSYDEGKTWAVSKCLHEKHSSYSCLAVTADNTVLCLYEGGKEHRREWLRLARFNLEWLTDSEDIIVHRDK